MAAFIVSPFGVFVMSLFADLFTVPSWQTFIILAYGWAVASGERQTITTYLWLSGATQVKHFSCYYTFLGRTLYEARWQLWARVIRRAARWVPEGAPRQGVSVQCCLGKPSCGRYLHFFSRIV